MTALQDFNSARSRCAGRTSTIERGTRLRQQRQGTRRSRRLWQRTDGPWEPGNTDIALGAHEAADKQPVIGSRGMLAQAAL